MTEGGISEPSSRAPRRKPRQDGLKAELEARIAEAEWLKSHYDEQLRAAFAQIASLQARVQALTVGREAEAAQGGADAAELDRLRQEVARLTEAEKRYLDRIDELKEAHRP
jgi:chromosome segregation ATPase